MVASARPAFRALNACFCSGPKLKGMSFLVRRLSGSDRVPNCGINLLLYPTRPKESTHLCGGLRLPCFCHSSHSLLCRANALFRQQNAHENQSVHVEQTLSGFRVNPVSLSLAMTACSRLLCVSWSDACMITSSDMFSTSSIPAKALAISC